MHINKLKNENQLTINCYALNAASAAFTFFEHCDNRFVIPTTTLFQHNVTVHLKGSFEEIFDYCDNNDKYYAIYMQLTRSISEKIKLPYKSYLNKIKSNWEIKGGDEILKNNLADEIVILTL
jgi:ATP-dependent protease ClpP protease subunit